MTVALGVGGTLSITFVAPSNGPSAHAIFDVTGYFTSDASGATYHALSPDQGSRYPQRHGRPIRSVHQPCRPNLHGRSGVPAGAIAVTGNLTVTGQTSSRLPLHRPGRHGQPGQLDSQLPGG